MFTSLDFFLILDESAKKNYRDSILKGGKSEGIDYVMSPNFKMKIEKQADKKIEQNFSLDAIDPEG